MIAENYNKTKSILVVSIYFKNLVSYTSAMESGKRMMNSESLLQPDSIDIHEERVQHIISKLYQIFQDGYRPARGFEPYNFQLDNKRKVSKLVNCFGHVLNLRNAQFNDYKIGPYQIYGYFPNICSDTDQQAAQRMFDFLKEIGLKIEECAPDKTIEDFRSWKIALYFENTNRLHKDFHFILEESPDLWSSKLGFSPNIEHLREKNPPEVYQNLLTDEFNYERYGAFIITNPKADENNPYIKGLEQRKRSLIIKPNHTIIKKQYLFESCPKPITKDLSK